MTATVLTTILGSGIALMIPVLWTGLGELIEEKAGIINVGIEGVMLIGAYTTAQVAQTTGSDVLGLSAGIGIGAMCGGVLAYLYVFRAVDQLITGLMFTLMALGLTTVLYQKNPAGTTLPGFQTLAVPGLSRIPVVGVMFRQTLLAYLAIAAAVAVWYALRHTWLGLYIRAVGDGPQTAATSGVSVHRIRAVSVVIGCAFIGLGGAALVLIDTGGFVAGVTNDLGFIALAMVMLAGWNAVALIGATFLFGVSDAMQYAVQNISSLSGVPHDVWLSIPYVATIVVLALTRARGVPRALGIPFPVAGHGLGGALDRLAGASIRRWKSETKLASAGGRE